MMERPKGILNVTTIRKDGTVIKESATLPKETSKLIRRITRGRKNGGSNTGGIQTLRKL